MRSAISKLSARCKDDTEVSTLSYFKSQLAPLWYDLHFDDAISSTLYTLGFETVIKQKVTNLKRWRRNLKLELQRLSEDDRNRGSQKLRENNILEYAKQVGAVDFRSYRIITSLRMYFRDPLFF